MSAKYPVIMLVAIALCMSACVAKQAAPNPEPSPEVELKPAKYDQLTEAIKAQHGKVVVVEIWSVY